MLLSFNHTLWTNTHIVMLLSFNHTLWTTTHVEMLLSFNHTLWTTTHVDELAHGDREHMQVYTVTTNGLGVINDMSTHFGRFSENWFHVTE